jgi:dienelactone hydrolase
MENVHRTCLLLIALAVCSAQDASVARRRQALDDTLRLLTPSNPKASARINAIDHSWEEWVRRTGELPPDFDALPSMALLPDPLAGVSNKEQWQKRREWIRQQYEHWIVGTMPPKPDNLRAVVTDTRQEGGVTVREVRLEFGPDHKAILHLQLVIPPGKGPFPVFLTNHPRTRPWIVPAVRRGYIGCIYYATDPVYGAPDDSDAYIELYPKYDFSAMGRWAWAGMRAVDYLVTLPEVDKNRIGLSGHSRNGKQALIAAAFDDRIAAVVPSSGNTGEGNPWRFTTDPYVNESIEQITGSFPGWFHPRLRFFAGREQKLPVDQNLLMAMVAPRGLLMASAYSEGQGAPFGFQKAFESVQRVYAMFDASDKLGLSLRPGEHPTTAEDIERYVDFFDGVFGRNNFVPPRASLIPVAPQPVDTNIPARTAAVQDRMKWLLGDEPPVVPFPVRPKLGPSAMTNEGWLGTLFGRPLKIEGARAYPLPFGDDLKGDLYMPDPLPAGPVPAVVWLHPYAYATGYSRYASPTIKMLTSAGYAVLAFDQIGFGTRIQQGTRFYERYPRWSLLGKMVGDTRAAVRALAALEPIDSKRIYLAGFSLGGNVALWTAALDPSVAGVIAASAFTPLRTAGKATEGLEHYTSLHALLPRLHQFENRKSEIPVDYDEILAAIAPRPVYVRAPELDRYANVDDVRRVVKQAGSHVTLVTPRDFCRFRTDAQREAFDWLRGLR